MRIWMFALSGIVVILALMPIAPDIRHIFDEGGPIETPSAILLLLSGLSLFLMRPVVPVLHLILLCLLLAEREFDNELLPEDSWFRGAVEWLEVNVLRETIPALILGALLVYGLWKYTWPHVRAGGLWRTEVGRFLLLGLAFAVLSQAAGEGLKHLKDYISEVSAARLYVIEEMWEFYFAIAVAVATALAISNNRRNKE